MQHQIILFLLILCSFQWQACAQVDDHMEVLADLPAVITDPAQYNELSPQEQRVILHQGTEWSFSGAYHDLKEKGTYICRQCNQPLFESESKFDSGTGWPSFDDYLASSVEEVPDKDGRRTEIVCSNCDGHLGHVFYGEGFTPKQTRHCVNSASLNFVSAAPKVEREVQSLEQYTADKDYEELELATFAGGCFWCTEASFEQLQGVVEVISGYTGGDEEYPTYKQVSAGATEQAEAIAIYYDPQMISYATLLEVFFVAHDPTQLNRQGPDRGKQYRSAIFYHNDAQREEANAYMAHLGQSSKFSDPIVTQLAPANTFWVAEAYHQDYYVNHPDEYYIMKVSRPKVEKVRSSFPALLKDSF